MTTPMLAIPNEILFEIAKLLPRADVVALQETCINIMHPLHAFLLAEHKNEIMLFAATYNRLPQLQLALAAGADVRYCGPLVGIRHTPALHRAAAGGHTTIITELLHHNAPLEDRGEHHLTPLLYAAKNGHQAVVDLLLAAGADASACDDDDSLLVMAIKADLESTAIAQIHQMNQYALTQAFQFKRLSIARLMFQRGIAATVTPPIQIAVCSGLEFVELCIEYGAEIDAVGLLGNAVPGEPTQVVTALSVAALTGDTDMIQYLLDQGANADLPADHLYQRPIMLATYRCCIGAVELLLQHGVGLGELLGEGMDLVWTACRNGTPALLAMLLDALEARNFNALSRPGLLCVAAGREDPGIARLLLARGAEVGPDALKLAVFAGFRETAEALIEGGASVDALSERLKIALTQLVG
ncbi:actin- protein 3 [Maublancomyces gigas]|uniref:Actin- protein 3 n=1 Tax=Discina gigas TaxID=1032678 RepID=A0ABR3GUE1_9PEZI